jgi:RimJ/RimL family protein N-acetyltransferase
MTAEDVTQDYADWLNDPLVNKYLLCADTKQTMDSCISYVQSYYERKDAALIGVFLKSEGLHIGNATLSSIDWKSKSGVIGISIGRKDMWGKGLAREALNAVVNLCFTKLKLHRLQAGIHTSNLRSVILFLKCGFKVEALFRDSDIIEGKFHDSYVVSILKPEFDTSRCQKTS